MSHNHGRTGRYDLHMHTTYSDGRYTPGELLEKCSAARLNGVSVTDHDTIDAWPELVTESLRVGLELISGVELSTNVDGQEVHILGYYFDPEHAGLNAYLAQFQQARLVRAEAIIERLHALGIPLSLEEVLKQAGDGAVGRPHIALAMVSEGHVSAYRDAFMNYIGNGAPAYVARVVEPPEVLFDLLREAGGISVLAHPGHTFDSTIMRLIRAGLDGIETMHPSHDAQVTAYYKNLAREFYLVQTGGSDFHGHREIDEEFLGQYTVSSDQLESIRGRVSRFSH